MNAVKFGEAEASDRFFDLSAASHSKAKILQDLFAGTDIVKIKKELALPTEAGFDKMIATLFYAPNRQDVINQISTETKRAFETMFATLIPG